MEYGKIIAVTGMPGLFELLTSKNDGAIVRSLEDNNTKFVSSRIHNFSHLESIEVFTVKENVNLVEIFYAMDKEEGKAPDLKDAAAVKKYFQRVYPDLDFERVYSSDLKKMAKWYDILKANKIEIKLSPPAEEEKEEAEVVEETPAKQEKKTASKTKEPKEDVELAEAPAKKKAKTKAAPEGEEDEKPKKAAAKKTTERKQPDATSGVEEKNKTARKAPAKKSAPKKK
jgi:hypothetical protein